MDKLIGKLSSVGVIHGELSSVGKLSGSFSINSKFSGYHGEYVITPNLETQILQTSGKVLSENVVINPVPNNYGLITWNGSILTVS